MSDLVEPVWPAQYGEDRILRWTFPRSDGVFVEIGAADGVENSNTWWCEQIGWRGVLVEANPVAAAACARNRTSTVVHCAVSAPGSPPTVRLRVARDMQQLSSVDPDSLMWRLHGVHDVEEVEVPARTVDDVLAEHLGGAHPDFVTIDVEGHEWPVLQGFDLDRWQPQLVLIERNFLPDRRIFAHMRSYGYGYLRTTGVNDWFGRGVPMSRLRDASVRARLGVRPGAKRLLDRAGLMERLSGARHR